jgi:hypothetical protein
VAHTTSATKSSSQLRAQRALPAEADRSSDAAVVLQPGGVATLAAFGRQRTLNGANYCVPVSTVRAGQQQNGQIAVARDTVYGSVMIQIDTLPRRQGHLTGEGVAAHAATNW